MRETITLQLGNYANFVGAHYWNLQGDEALSGEGDNAHLFRGEEGAGAWQPRVLICDLRGNLGRMMGDFDDCCDDEAAGEQQPEWATRTDVLRRDLPEANPFQQFLQSCDAASYDAQHVFVQPAVAAGGLSRQQQQYMQRQRDQGRGGEAESAQPPQSPSQQPQQQGQRKQAGRRDASRPSETLVAAWTDFLTSPLSPSSACMLPLWTTHSVFDTFLAPQQLPGDFLEGYMDQMRRLAEECDSLQTVQMLVDLQDGFGALGGRVCEAVREEYGAVRLPVWAFDAQSAGSEARWQADVSDSLLAEALSRLGVAHSMAHLIEHASAVIPVQPSAAAGVSAHVQTADAGGSVLRYHSSAVVAAAIEALCGGGGGGGSSGDWLARASNAGRFPLLELEADLPWSRGPDAPLGYVAAEFDDESAEAEERRGGATRAAPSSRRQRLSLNPFLHNLSSATTGQFAVPEGDGPDLYLRSRHKPFTNALSLRGPTAEALPALLFSKCSHRYTLSSLGRVAAPIHLPVAFPCFFRGVDDDGHASGGSDLTGASRITAAAAVACDERMGMHVERVAEHWAAGMRSGRVRAQCEKLGLHRDEAAEVAERLRAAARCYDSTIEL